MGEITIPNGWVPMQHQMPVWNAMAEGVKRAILCWHRRAGKDSFAINYLMWRAMQKPGVYWHMLPTAAQGRKVIWNGIDRDGRRVLDQAIPKELREQTRDDEMYVRLKNGSIIQIVGSDNFDNLVGANPVGVVFSEYAIANPAAWDYIRPMLMENRGFAIFISTPRGRNHFHKLYDANKDADNWFCEVRTVADTYREDGSPIIDTEDLAEERRSGMSETKLKQEYFCSWEGGLEGAYFTDEVADIRTSRLVHLPYSGQPVMSAWDIGVKDRTAIGVFMRHPENGMPVLMDAYEDRNKGLTHYAGKIREWSMRYAFKQHVGPHDLKKTEWSTNKRIVDRAASMGLHFDVLDRSDRADGIDNLRAFLQQLYVNHNDNTEHVLNMLHGYRRKFDEKLQVFSDTPVKDFTTDSVDMMRYASLGYNPTILSSFTPKNFSARRAVGR